MTPTGGAGSTIIVGAGLMGQWHVDAARHAGAQVTAVVDRDLARAQRLARGVPGARALSDLGEALTTSGAVVHVCTGLESHMPLALAALNAGCHVLIEKPATPDAQALDLLLAVAAERKLLVCPVHQFLFQRGVLRISTDLARLGTLRHFEMEVASTGAESGSRSRDEVALEILPHGLALAARICGTRISTRTWSLERATDGEIAVSTVVGETRIAIRISMRGRPPVNRLRLVGDAATVEVDLFSGFAVWDTTSSSRFMKLFRPIRSSAVLGMVASVNLTSRVLRAETAYPGLRELVRRFHEATAGQGPLPIAIDETKAVTALWTQLRLSLQARTAAIVSADHILTRS